MSKDIIQIKGTMHGLIITMDGNQDFNVLKDNLRKKIENSKGFFNGAKFTFRINNNLIADNDTDELRAFCLSQGLIYDSAIPFPVKQKEAPIVETNNNEPKKENPSGKIDNAQKVGPRGLTQTELEQETLLVKQNLRSGQRIIYPGNVVVLGDVNPGAYIIAGGNIIIMGTLRGTAHAGASGDEESAIVAYKLKPSQIRIAQSIGRSPDNESELLAISPEVAKIAAGQILVEQLNQPRSSRKPSIAR